MLLTAGELFSEMKESLMETAFMVGEVTWK
jgi:hypothetical protein